MTMMPPPRMSRTGHFQLNDAADVRGNMLRDAWQQTLGALKMPKGAYPGPKPIVPCGGLPAVAGMDSSQLTAQVWKELSTRVSTTRKVDPKSSEVSWEVVADGKPIATLQQPDDRAVAGAVAAMPSLPVAARRSALLGQRDWIAIYFAQDLVFQPSHGLVLDLLDIATQILMLPVFSIKHGAAIKRPWVVDARKPAPPFDRPWHPSWPSGHASTAWLHAYLIGQLAGADIASEGRLAELADHVSTNRELSQVHTNLDSQAGREVGLAMGRWLLDVAVGDCINAPHWAALVAEASAAL